MHGMYNYLFLLFALPPFYFRFFFGFCTASFSGLLLLRILSAVSVSVSVPLAILSSVMRTVRPWAVMHIRNDAYTHILYGCAPVSYQCKGVKTRTCVFQFLVIPSATSELKLYDI